MDTEPANVWCSLNEGAPVVMGVLNVTPDSFSDGGQWTDTDDALRRAAIMCAEGAGIIDIGGESTRPGAAPVSVQQELDRVVPVIEKVSGELGVMVSIDTSKPEVMRAAAAAGAGMINDVYALTRPGALAAAAETGLPVCLMHMSGNPGSMQQNPRYTDVVEEVESFLLQQVKHAQEAGIPASHIALDPGFGFGKTVEHNLQLLRNLPRLASHGMTVLAGLSRKSMLQAMTGRAIEQRLAGSLALAVMAAQGGAQIIRVHDVAETVDVLNVLKSVWPERPSPS